jgi:hypothetical protein
MQITISAAQCRTLYEDVFKVNLPENMHYANAANLAKDKVGESEFMERLSGINRNGTYRV